MNLLGYEISIAKRVPAGGKGTSIVDQADRTSGRTGGEAILGAGTPARGDRPDPGPRPRVEAAGDPEDQRHQPLRYQFPYAVNQVWTPRRTLTPFAILRQLAEVSDLIRICVETRKDQLCSLSWDIVARDKKQGEARADQCAAARTFFRQPDKRRSFSTWLRMAIEDVLVIDALSVYRRKTRGGELYALELKDGATFLPLLAADGDYPLAPEVAFRQIIQGVPVQGGDCSLDQLYYRPRTVRTHTPYGLSPTEAVLLTVNAALNREVFNLNYYTEGNIPEALLEAPANFTTKQLLEFQEYIDYYLSGDLAKRRRMKVVHQGSNVHEFKDPDFTTVYDEWLLKVICAAFGVLPGEIGFTADINKSTGESQENATYRRSIRPLSLFFKDLFDDVLALDLAMPDVEFVWIGGEAEDKYKQAQVDEIYVNLGATSVDDIRARNGQEPIGLGPYVSTPMGPVFVDDLLAEDPDDDPSTSEVRSPEAGRPTEDPGTTPRGTAVSDEAKADLKKWRAVAVKCVKAGKPIREFASEAIPLELHARVDHFLSQAGDDVAKVVAAFDLGLAVHQAVAKSAESRTLTRAELRMAKAVKKVAARHFRTQGAAFADHLKKGLES